MSKNEREDSLSREKRAREVTMADGILSFADMAEEYGEGIYRDMPLALYRIIFHIRSTALDLEDPEKYRLASCASCLDKISSIVRDYNETYPRGCEGS